MFTRQPKRKPRSLFTLPTPVNALGGILIGIIVAYLVIWSSDILDGNHQFNTDTVVGLSVIGLIVLLISWYESEKVTSH